MDDEDDVKNLQLILSSSDEDEGERKIVDVDHTYPMTRILADMKTELKKKK